MLEGVGLGRWHPNSPGKVRMDVVGTRIPGSSIGTKRAFSDPAVRGMRHRRTGLAGILIVGYGFTVYFS